MPYKKWYLPGLMIVGLIFLAYIPSLTTYLRGDDFEWLKGSYWGWRHPAVLFELINNFFRPVVKLSYLLDYTCFGAHALFYNLTTIGIHLVNVYLLYVFLVKVSQKWTTAGVVALTFGISSYYSEVTLWSAGRPDSLLLVFILASLIYLNNAVGKIGAWRHILLVCLSLGALGSKETWVLLPLLALSFLWLVKQVPLKTVLKATGSVLVLLGIYLAVFIGIPLLSRGNPPTSYADPHAQAVLIKFCYLIARYCGLGDLYTGAGWQSFVIIVSVLGVTLWLVKSRNHLALWGMFWMLLTMFSSLPIYHAPSRYNYLPLVGFWIMVVALTEKTLASLNQKIAVKSALIRFCIALMLVFYVSYQVIMLQWEIKDYQEYGNFHKSIVTMYQAIKAQIPFDRPILFVNQGVRRPTSELEQSYRGYPKLLFRRDTGIWELINFDALANFTGKPFAYLVRLAPQSAIKELLEKPWTALVFRDQGFQVLAQDPVDRQKLRQFYDLHGRLPERMLLYQISSTK